MTAPAGPELPRLLPADARAAESSAEEAPCCCHAELGQALLEIEHEHATSHKVGILPPHADDSRVVSWSGARWAVQRTHICELTGRQYEVFLLLGQGMGNHKISLLLGVGERTVKLHVTRILCKLGLDSRLQAGLVAAEHELLAHFPKVQ